MKKQNWRRIFVAAIAAVLSVPGKDCLVGNPVGAAFAAPTSSQGKGDGTVDSTVPLKKETSISLNGGKVVLTEGAGRKSEGRIPGQICLVDGQATEDVRRVYAYLSGVGQTEGVIYGHQNDTWHKAGTEPDGKNGMTDSDTADVTGSISGIVGIDTLSLTGEEYTARRYNEKRSGANEAGKPGTLVDIQEPVREAWEVDNFENYGGDVALLSREWATNKAAGCAVSLSLSEENGAEEGRFGMGLHYEEGTDGWAGVTTALETDWSEWSALSFYTLPDGNNQKVVIQIQADGITYEAYLNEYEEYRDSRDAMRVTIPFAQFHERDAQGQPKGGLTDHAKEISSFGLWVNAVNDSPELAAGMVEGTIYYDDIRAVTAEEDEVVFEKIAGHGTREDSITSAR